MIKQVKQEAAVPEDKDEAYLKWRGDKTKKQKSLPQNQVALEEPVFSMNEAHRGGPSLEQSDDVQPVAEDSDADALTKAQAQQQEQLNDLDVL